MGPWGWGWFNIKMSSYQYRKSHCGDKTLLRPSYLHNGISYTGKMTSSYWIRALDPDAWDACHKPSGSDALMSGTQQLSSLHYVTWWSWYLKSLATELFLQQFVQANTKENTKALHYRHFVRGSHRWPVDFPQNWTVIWKVFLHHAVIMLLRYGVSKWLLFRPLW